MSDYVRGRVRWFDDKKGYGFLNADGDSDKRDIFCHYRVIQCQKRGRKSLKDGQLVMFKSTKTDRGYQATEVFSIAQ